MQTHLIRRGRPRASGGQGGARGRARAASAAGQVRGLRHQGRSLRSTGPCRMWTLAMHSTSERPPHGGGACTPTRTSQSAGRGPSQCSRDELSRDVGWRVVLGEPCVLPPSLPRHKGGPTGAWLQARGRRPQNLQPGGGSLDGMRVPRAPRAGLTRRTFWDQRPQGARPTRRVPAQAVLRLRAVECVAPPPLPAAISTAQSPMKRHLTSESPKKRKSLAN